MLIDAQTLVSRLDEDQIIVIDCRFSPPGPEFRAELGREQYDNGHIPGALYVDLERDLSRPPAPDSGRHPLPDPAKFLNKLQDLGVSPERKVVVYDDCGGMFAARFWWMLKYWVGHTDVFVLDGGFAAWRAENLKIELELPSVVATDFRYQICDDFWVSTTEVAECVSSSKKNLLIDARAYIRFIGEQENIDTLAGHIPTALNLPCADNLTSGGKFIPARQLEQRFRSAIGSNSDAALIHYCGSGVTACHNIFAMELAGLPAGKLYVGSWSEWIRFPENPVE